MKEILDNLHKAFDNKARLGIMSILMVNDAMDFNSLKSLLGLTDGNLSSHISALEKESFLHSSKSFLGKKPHTTYSLTPAGKTAFQKHLQALEDLVKGKF
jgi:DNA-binding MarR family transcriptional regulator